MIRSWCGVRLAIGPRTWVEWGLIRLACLPTVDLPDGVSNVVARTIRAIQKGHLLDLLGGEIAPSGRDRIDPRTAGRGTAGAKQHAYPEDSETPRQAATQHGSFLRS